MIIGEVVAGEGAILARRFVDTVTWGLCRARRPAAAEHLGRAVGASPRRRAGYRSKRFIARSIMRLAARTSACRIAVVASTSTMIALSTSIR